MAVADEGPIFVGGLTFWGNRLVVHAKILTEV
jgi:hypothetical protein